MQETGGLSQRVKVRSSQYLNNLIEQDHRRVKHRIGPMLGFKRFENAVVTISGELRARREATLCTRYFLQSNPFTLRNSSFAGH